MCKTSLHPAPKQWISTGVTLVMIILGVILVSIRQINEYERGIKYVLTINTWVNNKMIYLGTYLLDRNDSNAVTAFTM